ncbi:MAG TPA: glycosyltransferase [Nitrospiraceae bacterium]|nr:glycosyltransferase [Nitrospiraceae bacterium]
MGEGHEISEAVTRSRSQPRTSNEIRVLALIAANEVTGPLRGLFQLIEHAKDVRFILGMFLVKGHQLTRAVAEAVRRGFEVELLTQAGRYDIGLLIRTGKIIRTHHPTVIQSHGYKSALVAWICGRLYKIPWLAFSHGYTSENRRISLYNRLDAWVLRRADAVVAMSRAMADQLAAGGVPVNRIHVIHNAIDPAERCVDGSGPRWRRRWGISAEEVVVGVIGRLSPEKGQQIFLEAFQGVVAQAPNRRAVFIGDGPEKERLRQQVSRLGLANHVLFTGHDPHIEELYPALDLVVIPSLSEGLPNVLLEALLYGKPIVAAEVGGIPEILKPAAAGWLVPPGDAGALEAAMLDALQDRERRASSGLAGWEYVRRHCGPQRRMEAVRQVYHQILEESHGPPRQGHACDANPYG